jgi:hypothetical protein
MICVRLATLGDAGVIERQRSSVERLHNEALPMIVKPQDDPSVSGAGRKTAGKLLHPNDMCTSPGLALRRYEMLSHRAVLPRPLTVAHYNLNFAAHHCSDMGEPT